MFVEFITPTFPTCSLRLYDNNTTTGKTNVTGWHMHTEIEMILLLSGSKNFYIHDEIIQLNPGDIIFVNGNVPHRTETPVGSSWVLLQFNEGFQTSDISDYHWLNYTGSIPYMLFKKSTKINSDLSDCIQKIRTEYSKKEKSYDYFIKSYIYEVIAILYRNSVLIDYNEWRERILPLDKVIRYIDKHYAEHISLSEISKMLNFHSSYFCKIFKNITGLSFVQYLNLVRLNKAKELMKNTSKNITEISYEVGFSSASYFIKTFKNYHNYSPNKYRHLLKTASHNADFFS